MPHTALTTSPEASYFFQFPLNGVKQTGNIQTCSCRRNLYQHTDFHQSNELREYKKGISWYFLPLIAAQKQ